MKQGSTLKKPAAIVPRRGTLHNLYVALARNLTQYTLNDVLVSTPVPETDDVFALFQISGDIYGLHQKDAVSGSFVENAWRSISFVDV